MSHGLWLATPHSLKGRAGDPVCSLFASLAFHIRAHRIQHVIAAVLICSGCGPAAPRPAEGVEPGIRANQLVEEGQHRLAAEEFLRLAGLYPNSAVHYQLRSAEAYIDAGDAEAAGRVLADTSARDRNDKVHAVLLRARLALLTGHAQEALSMTADLTEDTPVSLKALRHSVRADAFQETGDHLSAVRERVILARHQTEERGQQENAQRLWTNLHAVGQEDLRLLTGSNEADLGGWAELALMNRSLGTRPDVLRQSLASWIESHPGHPSIPIITDQILADSERFQSTPTHIALLLPFTGQYAEAAKAIRDGFISAWFHESGLRPRVAIYDTNAMNIVEQYQSALSAGADMVVGPLEKAAIGALLQSGEPAVTTLALNYQDPAPGTGHHDDRISSGVPRLVEFGLAPEDEALQVAGRAFFDGHSAALVMTPDNEWGTRLAQTFSEQWLAFGGRVVEQVRYEAGAIDFGTPVKELLNIDSSEIRQALLRQKLARRLETAPRVREDADMIFLAAVPVYARQIVPQLRYHRAEDIPVYASSHVFTGVTDPQIGVDMDGVLFPDMPWILAPDTGSASLRDAVNRNWSSDTSAFRRLYAFGVDAFCVIPHLGRLVLEDGSSYAGETGELYVDRHWQLHRKLLWARFVDGSPKLLDDQ